MGYPRRARGKKSAATETGAAPVASTDTAFFWDEVAYTERSLAIACIRGREAVVSRFRALLAEYGLTEQQWRTLRVLYDYEPVPLTELCALCCIHKVSMTRILRALIERGLVERMRQGGDKRAYEVSLNQAGRSILDRTTPIANDIYAGVALQLGLEKTQQLLALLNELAQINSTSTQPKVPPDPGGQLSLTTQEEGS